MRKLAIYLATLGGIWAWHGQPSRAQGGLPEPSPTNAVELLDERLKVEGNGIVPLGDPELGQRLGYQAAVLSGYQQLFWQGAELMGLFPKDMPQEHRRFRLDDQHPNRVLLDWLLRAEVISHQEFPGRIRVQLQSPPVAELTQENIHELRALQRDLDGDGQPERISITYDGRIRILKPQGEGYKVVASSEVLNVFSCSSMRRPGMEPWEQVQLTRVLGIGGVESLPPGEGQPLWRTRVVAELALGEMVGEHWVGKASEQREILLRWDDPANAPSIELSEPQDFQLTPKTQVALKGLLRTPSRLQSARLRVNGRPFWQTPDSMASLRLKMDLMLPLLPGFNRAQVQLQDQAGRMASREVLLYRDARSPGLNPARRRALLIGVSEYASSQFPPLPRVADDLNRLQDHLKGDFEQVVVLRGQEATRARILESLSRLAQFEGEERSMLLVYFAGFSASSQASKALLPYDARGFDEGALGARELSAAVGDLKQLDVALLVDTSHSNLQNAGHDQLWLDSREFAERLSRQGWAVLSSVDAPASQRDGTQGSRFLSGLVEASGKAADLDSDGWVEWDELYRQLFLALRVSSPATPIPIRRGELLGRTAVSRVR